MSHTYTKTANERLKYVFDFAPLTNGTGESDWLASGVTIASKTVTVDSGLTKTNDYITDTNTSVTVLLDGGTAGTTYKVTCQITTSESPSETVERSIYITVIPEK